MSKPRMPAGLGPKAKKLWSDIVGPFELNVDELRVLEDACREIDLIEAMSKELKSQKLVVHGSMGQPVANPLVQELRQHRALVQRLLTSLKLPEEEEPAGTSTSSGSGARSTSARAAAAARWGRGA